MKVDEAARAAAGDHARRQQPGRPPQGWGVAGWSRDGFEVPTTCRDLAGSFLNVVARLTEFAGDDPTSVRCIFEFTR